MEEAKTNIPQVTPGTIQADIVTPDDTQKEERTFTQDELNVIIQKRLAEEQDKARLEADKKAAMSLAEREQELAAREAAIKRREQSDEASVLLIKKGMSGALSEFLNYTDANSLQRSIEKLETIYQSDVQRGVELRFKTNGYLPRASAVSNLTTSKSKTGSFLNSDEAFASGLKG